MFSWCVDCTASATSTWNSFEWVSCSLHSYAICIPMYIQWNTKTTNAMGVYLRVLQSYSKGPHQSPAWAIAIRMPQRHIWVLAWENVPSDICAQRRLKSDCICAAWFESSLGAHVQKYVFGRCGPFAFAFWGSHKGSLCSATLAGCKTS